MVFYLNIKVQGGKLLTSPMVLSNGSTVYTAGYQTPLQGMAYVPIHTGQQVQQFTSAQGFIFYKYKSDSSMSMWSN